MKWEKSGMDLFKLTEGEETIAHVWREEDSDHYRWSIKRYGPIDTGWEWTLKAAKKEAELAAQALALQQKRLAQMECVMSDALALVDLIHVQSTNISKDVYAVADKLKKLLMELKRINNK